MTTIHYDYDRGQIYEDMNGSNVLQTRYVLGPGVDEKLARISSGGTAAWLLTDRQDSLRNVVDGTGATIDTITYDGYGNVQSESNSANGGAYKYARYRVDGETNLLRPDPMTGRYYNPATGTWNGRDEAWDGNNLYDYVRNRPTNATDPTGLIKFEISQYYLIMLVRVDVDWKGVGWTVARKNRQEKGTA